MSLEISLKFLEICSKYVFVWVYGFFSGFQVVKKITSAKKCRRDTMILLFTSAITSAFAECRRELERLCHVLSFRFSFPFPQQLNKHTFAFIHARFHWLFYSRIGGPEDTPTQQLVFPQKVFILNPFKANGLFLANLNLFKVSNRNSRKRCDIYSELTIKTSERRH